MTGRVTDFQAEAWLSSLGPAWFGLHHDNPVLAGAYASEVFGGGYARARSELSAPSNRSTWNLERLVYHSMPSVVVTHIGLWNAEVNGDLLVSIALDEPVNIVLSKTFSIPEREIAVSIG